MQLVLAVMGGVRFDEYFHPPSVGELERTRAVQRLSFFVLPSKRPQLKFWTVTQLNSKTPYTHTHTGEHRSSSKYGNKHALWSYFIIPPTQTSHIAKLLHLLTRESDDDQLWDLRQGYTNVRRDGRLSMVPQRANFNTRQSSSSSTCTRWRLVTCSHKVPLLTLLELLVLVKVLAAGMCHSDMLYYDESYEHTKTEPYAFRFLIAYVPTQSHIQVYNGSWR